MIRNHAEVIVKGNSKKELANMIGYNFRLGEIECAIGIEQLKKLKSIIVSRIPESTNHDSASGKNTIVQTPKINPTNNLIILSTLNSVQLLIH